MLSKQYVIIASTSDSVFFALLQRVWLIPSAHLPSIVAALDWDGRMRPLLAEVLQHRVIRIPEVNIGCYIL